MENRIIDNSLGPINQHDLQIIQSELRDIKELLRILIDVVRAGKKK